MGQKKTRQMLSCLNNARQSKCFSRNLGVDAEITELAIGTVRIHLLARQLCQAYCVSLRIEAATDSN